MAVPKRVWRLTLGVVALLLCLCPTLIVASICPSGWTNSATMQNMSKCYATTSVLQGSSFYQNYVTACRQLLPGADVLAIANGFENAEVAGYINDRGISQALIGYVVWNSVGGWLSKYGYTSYVNGFVGAGYTEYAAIQTNGAWSNAKVPGTVLCQYYVGHPETFPDPLADCPDGWRPSVTAPGKCYFTGKQNDFFDARQQCWDQHPELVNKTELVALTSDLEASEVFWDSPGYQWINWGRFSGEWEWMGDDQPNFKPIFPGNSNPAGPCSYLSHNFYQANDCKSNEADGKSMYGICEYFPNKITSTTTVTTTPAATTTTTASKQCPQNWKMSSFNRDKCLRAVQQPTDFTNARDLCKLFDNDADLLAISDDQELPKLGSDAGIDSRLIYWLGLEFQPGNGWGWISSGGGPIDQWAPGEPDTSRFPNHTCGALLDQQYVADDCSQSHNILCQLRLS